MYYTPVGGDPWNVLIGVTLLTAVLGLAQLVYHKPQLAKLVVIVVVLAVVSISAAEIVAAYPPYDQEGCWVWCWCCN